MRRLVAATVLVGCYAPTNGPGDAILAPPDDARADTTIAPADTAPDADPRTHFEYEADIAECIDPNAPNPQTCRDKNEGGGMQMVVDLNDSGEGNPWHAYIRFPIGGELAGKQITNVVLQVQATDDPLAPGPSSGEVFAVAPFSLADLATSPPPAKLDPRLAPAQSSIDKLEIVELALPVTSITAGMPAHFGIFPITPSGVNYWNSSGPRPPRLIVDTL